MNEVQPNFLAIIVAIVALGTLTFVAVTMTSFIKISIVLFILRNALGLQQTPPNLVLYGVALLLSGYVMAPVVNKVYAEMTVPGQHYSTVSDFSDLASRAQVPAKDFMLRFITPGEREFFATATAKVWGADSGLSPTPDNFVIVVPAFVLSELRRAFEAGFLLYLPFIAVDLTVTAVLMAMGMSAVSPTTISVPFKLFLFVAIEGWTRLMHGLVLGYAT
ncbi:type III secretion system export apparatus subunit SctR [Bradyrhizobium sp. STM 3557]|uniref:type III secretion system export apparatus subunit SctR n=1 Tax=Bradyrhizobium sp. STM 3557 TaxID=578920 RepID=UPI00388E3B52